MLKRAPAGVISTNQEDQKDQRGSKGSTGIKRINGYQGSHGSHTGLTQVSIRVSYFKEFGLKWVAVARIGLKLGGNEATRFRIIFKPDFDIKNSR